LANSSVPPHSAADALGIDGSAEPVPADPEGPEEVAGVGGIDHLSCPVRTQFRMRIGIAESDRYR
jgi:hypothetical protein